jgi:hypothetical protein
MSSSLSSELSSAHDAKQRHSRRFLIVGDPVLTIGCAPYPAVSDCPIGCLEGVFDVTTFMASPPLTLAFDQAAPGLVELWLLVLMWAPRRLLSATLMPLRALDQESERGR